MSSPSQPNSQNSASQEATEPISHPGAHMTQRQSLPFEPKNRKPAIGKAANQPLSKPATTSAVKPSKK
ncbi:MAG: hypothetical protein HC772_04650 [Leptolyngbyaceae cyanobacterium CRU_2_3]|nr:hypothetical protein [Leptolyngbyaceae cyanobacterium CRU_2_3]